jgi:hypothetical protein
MMEATMNILKKLTFSMSLMMFGALLVAPLSTVSAGPFDAARQEACRGAAFDNNANADDCADQGTAASEEVGATVQRIINILTIIVGIIAVIMIIVNGIRFITSGGDSNAVNSARNGILYAIIGLVVVALAQVIVRFVINRASG